MNRIGRAAYCALGGASAITLALTLTGPHASPFLLASLGASGTIVFLHTNSPSAQPRALLLGHLGAACIGIACQQLWGDAPWVYLVALGLALFGMLVLRCSHPPAGANVVIMIHQHAGFDALWQPIFVGVFSLAAVAFVWSRLHPGIKPYPTDLWAPSPPSSDAGPWRP